MLSEPEAELRWDAYTWMWVGLTSLSNLSDGEVVTPLQKVSVASQGL